MNVFFRYKIDYLSAESAFLFNIKFSACFESKGDCMLNIPIMQDVKIPFLSCNFSMQPFAIPGEFSCVEMAEGGAKQASF